MKGRAARQRVVTRQALHWRVASRLSDDVPRLRSEPRTTDVGTADAVDVCVRLDFGRAHESKGARHPRILFTHGVESVCQLNAVGVTTRRRANAPRK